MAGAEAEYKRRVDEAIAAQDTDQVRNIVQEVLNLPSVASTGRLVLEHIGSTVVGRKNDGTGRIEGGIRDDDKLHDLVTDILGSIRSHATSLSGVDWQLRKILYDLAGDTLEAARAFAEAVNIPEEERPFAYVRIAQNFLEADDDGNADAWIRRAAEVIDMASWDVKLQFRVCRARIADARRSFIQAAQLYLDISQEQNAMLMEDEMLVLLNDAATCIILERAGPQRQRVMGKIFKDSRASRIDCSYMLEKMYMERIVTPDESRRFESRLKPHHLARLRDGSTVLERAIREHNIMAASKVYHNISFEGLGALLRMSAEQAERVAAEMIQSDRLVASIDQVDGMLFFQSASDALTSWDRQLQELCTSVSQVTEAVAQAHPELAETAEMRDDA